MTQDHLFPCHQITISQGDRSKWVNMQTVNKEIILPNMKWAGFYGQSVWICMEVGTVTCCEVSWVCGVLSLRRGLPFSGVCVCVCVCVSQYVYVLFVLCCLLIVEPQMIWVMRSVRWGGSLLFLWEGRELPPFFNGREGMTSFSENPRLSSD